MNKELLSYLEFINDLGIETIPNIIEEISIDKGQTNINGVQTRNNENRKSVQKNTASSVNKPNPKTYINPADIKIDFSKYQNYSSMEDLSEKLKKCTKCSLSKLRKNVVIGEGSLTADLMFIGEAPGETEDKTGQPFVGRAGKLLTKIIEAMHLSREKVYIANIVKCRPPGNRNPQEEEVNDCFPYLLEQINLIKPKIIVVLGAVALKSLLKNKKLSITMLRGKYIDWNGYKLMPTFHPAYLLRNPPDKKYVWADMKKVMSDLGIKL